MVAHVVGQLRLGEDAAAAGDFRQLLVLRSTVAGEGGVLVKLLEAQVAEEQAHLVHRTVIGVVQSRTASLLRRGGGGF